MNLNQSEVMQAVLYNQDSGEFTRRSASGYRNCHKAGAVIGSVSGSGYLESTLRGNRVLLHRLAFVYITGEWPATDVDHIDGNKTNNSWENLRLVTRQVNIQNQRRARLDNKSTKLLGCSFDKWSGKYVARIKSNGKYLNLGRYSTQEAAHAAYIEAKRKLHEGNTL